MTETAIVKGCIQLLRLKGVYCWRSNNVGIFNPKTGGYFFHGLRGVSDILGILPQTHQGAKFGNLLAIECKMPGKSPTNEQRAFLREVNERGGIGICVHSVEELASELERF